MLCEAILESLNKLGVNPETIYSKNRILKEIELKFSLNKDKVWWLSFGNKKFFNLDKDDDNGYLKIVEFLNSEKITIKSNHKFYFIMDIDEEHCDKIVAILEIKDIIFLIEDNFYFEYYICPTDFSWLLCENDHNDLMIIYSDL